MMGDNTVYAFPQSMAVGDIARSSGGMTLRDWFAGQALVGFIAAQGDAQWIDESYPIVSRSMYRMADAMLAAGRPRDLSGEE